ncbi:hypothetical protein RB2150_04258 [Rhodobacterales bacterium HTCC2150]|nr:hypothetical protein RB2150_04258 [Rhodobacterales bacterium HTCC2150] [Rhodobacteraceae bacterium HTCC2150]
MNFHDVRFPSNLSFGSIGGPERRTDIVTLANGFEERNTPWAHGRRRYDAGISLRSLDDVSAMIAFFEARQGQLYGFRWKDWGDFKSCLPSKDIGPADQIIGKGDGENKVFYLQKQYRSGAQEYHRPVTKPVQGSVRVSVEDVENYLSVEFELDVTTGRIEFNDAPYDGATISAGFEFDVPVRFDTDRIQTSVASFRAGDVPNVPVVEVRV